MFGNRESALFEGKEQDRSKAHPPLGQTSQILNTKIKISVFEGEAQLIAPETILAFQTVLLVPFFVSMAFRMKGNYLVHGIIMIVLAAIGWFAVAMSAPSFFDSVAMQPYTSSSPTLVSLGLHVFFGCASLVFATWLVALWRPRSTEFGAKSKRIWQLTAISWVLAYLVGLLLFVALTTTIL